MPALTIRPYQPSDTEAIKHLHVLALEATGAYSKSGPWDTDLDNIESVYLNNHGAFLTGWLGHTLVVMGALKKIDATTCELKRMRVRPEFQRKGYGQQMLKQLEKIARQLGYATIQLDTTVKQIAAQRLYEKHGYKELRRETEGWPLETIIYVKAV